MSSSPSILIIGGGASGLVAAIAAARNGSRVTVLERLSEPGKKILATGNGRCNLTNTREGSSFYHGTHPGFPADVLRQFPPAKALDFFAALGLLTHEEEEGRVYPACGQASAVLDVLRFELDRLNVKLHCDTEAQRILPLRPGFKVETRNDRSFTGDRVIMTAGGKAGANLGSNGSGLEMIQALGHRCVGPFPGLVQLNLRASFLKQADGVRFNGAAALLCDNRVLREEKGEILFTAYGVSGIPILQLSRTAGECLQQKRDVFLELRFFPDQSPQDLAALIQKRVALRSNETLERALIGLVNRQLLPALIHAAGIKSVHTPCRLCAPGDVDRLASVLDRWLLPVTGTQPFLRAQVTAGGADTDEIDARSLESKRIPGLYLAGEIVDVDGDCGGYNLQWAWASGFVAGTQAARA